MSSLFFQHSILSPVWTRRLLALLGSWAFMFSNIAFFFFDIGLLPVMYIFGVCGIRFWVVCATFAYFLTQLAIECRVRGIYKHQSSQVSTTSEKLESKKDSWHFESIWIFAKIYLFLVCEIREFIDQIICWTFKKSIYLYNNMCYTIDGF